MDIKIENGLINGEYKILNVTATYENDRSNLCGVRRLTSVEIECDENISNDVLEEAKNEILNYFAANEYFDENKNWRGTARKDLAKYTGIDKSNINID